MVRHKTLRFVRMIAVCACAMTALGTTPQLTSAKAAQPATILTIKKSGGKLTQRLAILAQSPGLLAATAQEQAQALSLPANGPGSLLRDSTGRLLVYIRTDNLSALNLHALTNAGASIVHLSEAYKTITAYVDAISLNALAAVTTVKSVQEEFTPVRTSQSSRADNPTMRVIASGAPNTPQACNPTISAGDTQLRAALARANYGVDGSGVKVGVLSDSYDQNTSAVTHAANDIASGDLPGIGNPCGRLTPVSVISNSLSTGATDEGRGMLQIIHDLAPGATIGFASANNGIYQFADNIRNLRAWGADIIVDDVGYFIEPAFQEGPVSVAISDVVGSGALYFTSAGNGNYPLGGKDVASYESPAFRPTTCPAGTPARETSCHNFNPSGSTNNASSFTLSNGGQAQMILQWAQPWNGVATDLDFYVLNSSNAIVGISEISSISAQIPFEYFSFTNSTGSTQTYRIVIGRYTGSGGGDTGAPRLKYYFTQSTFGLQTVQYSTSSGGDIVGPTLGGHSATEYGMSVAAAPYNDDVNPEYFSSHGPAVHYFGPVLGTTAAASITPRTLQQPDFTATDGGCTTFFYPPLSAGCYRFYGTSAAAPHAAAVAALMKQRSNQLGTGLSSNTARTLLQNSARAMSGGVINSVGAGLIDANAAAALIVSSAYHAYMPVAFTPIGSPPAAPALSAISNPGGATSYNVSWGAVTLAISYTLQEDTNSAFPNAVTRYTGAAISWPASGKAVGTYYYRVSAMNNAGTSGWSNVQSVTVTAVAPAAPALSAISNSSGASSYNVSWVAVALATSYTLQEDTNSAFPNAVTRYSGAAITWPASGKAAGTYYYRVSATNDAGTSGWSNVQSTTVNAPSRTPGFWASETGDEFYVTPDGASVKNFAIYIGGTCAGTIKITRTTLQTITNNQFSFTGAFYASGTFDSATAAHGTDGISSFNIGCATYTGGPWAWSATWQDSSQPAVTTALETGIDGVTRPVTVTITHGLHAITPNSALKLAE